MLYHWVTVVPEPEIASREYALKVVPVTAVPVPLSVKVP